jgi:hypothetical protein
MDKFDFLIVAGDKLYYGHLRATNGSEARTILEAYFLNQGCANIKKLELKGHTTSSFEINEVKL